ncbi:abortive infection Abi-like protein [Sphingomonas sp. BK036]|uniref:abortive infection family protein n=1 Tax=Sphingomonas sp. BK036 TaxID=2512122 RepID=UPI00102A9617|nr:abortive infection family protein [Sphingomonas sp. BK036]RZT58237.1 abortive infection Abi-like protein [Sphingomonas sp. BK036]
MRRVIKLIKENEQRFPECAKYYVPLIGKARRNLVKHPDISIETCKALLEGISKTVLIITKPEWDRQRIEKMTFAKLVTHAMQDLRDNDDVVEDEFKSHVVSFSQSLATLRNHRSDISHGRGAPKAMESSRRFALLSFHTSEAIALYMLEAYFERRTAALVVLPDSDDEQPLPGGLPDIEYEDNQEFNDELDSQFPLDGKLIYSFALYRLYYEDYIIELENYRDAVAESIDNLIEHDDGNAD